MQEEHLAMNLKMDSMKEHLPLVRADIEELQKCSNDRDIQIATINTKLANIETLLIDIKQDIKEK